MNDASLHQRLQRLAEQQARRHGRASAQLPPESRAAVLRLIDKLAGGRQGLDVPALLALVGDASPASPGGAQKKPGLTAGL